MQIKTPIIVDLNEHYSMRLDNFHYSLQRMHVELMLLLAVSSDFNEAIILLF